VRSVLVAALLLVGTAPASAFEFCGVAGKREAFHAALEPWRAALAEKRFSQLEAHFARMLWDHRLDRLDDARLERAFAIFEVADPATEPLLLAWAHAFPKSQAAYLALGHHYMARGFALTDIGSAKAADADRATDERELLYALHAFEVADRMGEKPTLSNAARIRIVLRSPGLKGLDAGALYRKTIAAYPNALEARIQYLKSREGGVAASLERIEAIMKDAGRMSREDERYIRYLGYQEAGAVLAADKPERAAEQYEKSVPLCPGLDRSLRLAVALYDRLGQAPDLERSAALLIDRHEHEGWAFAMRGRARKQQGRLEEAFKDFRRGVELACPCAYDELAWFYAEGSVVPRDLRRARELYELAHAHGRPGAGEKAARLAAGLAK
jgi:TPR repeat protein